MMRLSVFGAALLVGCGPEVDDGIFDASVSGGPPPASGSETGVEVGTTGPGGAESGESTSSSSGADPPGETGDATTAAEDLGCPEAVGPSTYQCPAGFAFWTEGNVAQCRVEDLALPPAPSLFSYCGYLDKGYLGFGWTLAEAPDFTCPLGSRYAPNATTGYCLWQDLEVPPGAVAECNSLTTERWLGFQWPCPPG